jgi:hypothetical protein
MRVVTAASDECLREASEHAERLRGDTARTGPLPKPRTRT